MFSALYIKFRLCAFKHSSVLTSKSQTICASLQALIYFSGRESGSFVLLTDGFILEKKDDLFIKIC